VARKPHQATLSLETIGKLANGQAAATINAALRAAVRDTEDRGDDKKPRKVTIEVELKKFGAEGVTATVKAKTTVPPYVTDPTVGTLGFSDGEAEVMFSPASASNPDQPALPHADDK
jgi:hypothetical protein